MDDLEIFRKLSQCEDKEQMQRVIDEYNESQKLTFTNADRIRAMSDEELADWLARTQISNTAEALAIAKIPFEQSPEQKEYVTKECLEWLKQPAEGSQ